MGIRSLKRLGFITVLAGGGGPVQYATKHSLIINLKAAKALGLAVPERVLDVADEVIE